MGSASGQVYVQAAAIPYRKRWGRLQVLVITSRRRRRWIVPKGLVDPGFTPEAAALQEAFEEAGVTGRIAGPVVHCYEYPKWDGVCRVQVFPMKVTEVLSRWPEKGMRDRRWVRASRAAGVLQDAGMSAALAKFLKQRD